MEPALFVKFDEIVSPGEEKKQKIFLVIVVLSRDSSQSSPEVAGDPIFGIGILFADPPLFVGYIFRWFNPLTRFAASE